MPLFALYLPLHSFGVSRRALVAFLNRALSASKYEKQSDLAVAAGASQQQISAWLKGDRVPHPRYARGLAIALDVDEVELLVLIGEAQAEETADIRSDRDLLLAKIEKVGEFVDQYEELGHSYRSMGEDVAWLRGQVEPLRAIFEQLNDRLARLEQRLPQSDPPD